MKSSLLVLSAVMLLGASVKANTTQDYVNAVSDYSIYHIRQALQEATDHGLYQDYYWSATMEREYSYNPNSYALKSQAVNNYLKMLKDISTGIVDPSLVGADIKISKKSFISASELRNRIAQNYGDLSRTAESLSPKIPEYEALREAHRSISQSCKQGIWNQLPRFSKTLSLGVSDQAVYDIKGRLMLLGYDIIDHSSRMDESTVDAIRDVQWSLRFKPDGKITYGGKTFQYLNTNCELRTQQLRQDMEKLRWFPQNLGNRYVFVNIAMSYLNMVDRTSGYSEFLNLKTITGRAARKTPTIVDRIVNVVINPYWVVPPTIFKEDKVEDLKRLSPSDINAYFDKSNYEVLNKDFSRKIDPSTIDWNGLNTTNADFYIRQKPHTGNALGSLKFSLTNSFAIYLHDTNQRQLLSEAQRQLSSGCVRVENPVSLAEHLLRGTKYDRYTIENTMAKPGQIMDGQTIVKTPSAMPVYMAYLTSQADKSRVVRFTEDDYLQNLRLSRLGVR